MKIEKLEIYDVSSDPQPPINKDIIIFGKSKAPKIACFIKNPSFPLDCGIFITYSYSGYGVVIEDKVTHWAFLPEVEQ